MSPPFAPCAVWRPAARNAASLRLEALASSPPRAVRRRLSARCHSAAPNILGAVAAPLCSDSLPRPLRARHRRASPRVLENAQGCSAPLLRPSTLRYAAASPVLLNFRSAQPPHSPVPLALRSLRRRRVRTSPYKSVQVRIPLPAPCALRKVLCQPEGMRFAFFWTLCTWCTGENLTFPPVCPPFARVLYGGLRHAMRLLCD